MLEKIKENWKIILILLAVFATVTFYQAAKNFSEQASYVSVKGLSEKIVPADNAVWSINFQIKSNDVNKLYNQIEKDIAIIKSFLKKEGFTDNEISVAPINIWQDTYNNAAYRYTSNTDISVYTKKVALVKKASAKTRQLLNKGIIMNQNNIEYTFSNLNSIKPEMIAEATKNAKKSAAQFAKNAGTSVGRLVRANQGVFSITEKDPASPEWKKVRVVSTLRYLLK